MIVREVPSLPTVAGPRETGTLALLEAISSKRKSLDHLRFLQQVAVGPKVTQDLPDLTFLSRKKDLPFLHLMVRKVVTLSTSPVLPGVISLSPKASRTQETKCTLTCKACTPK